MARARSRSQVRRMLSGLPGFGLSHDIRVFMIPPRRLVGGISMRLSDRGVIRIHHHLRTQHVNGLDMSRP
jgi:hypothetical protein